MPVKDVDVLGEAIADTEQELFHGAFDDEAVHDDSGNRDLEQLDSDEDGDGEQKAADADGDETEVNADGEKPGEDTKDDTDTKVADDGKVEAAKADEQAQEQQGRVPSARLREEAEKRKAVEAERDALRAEAERVIQHYRTEAEINRRAADDLRRAQQAQQPRQPKEDPEPDIFADPAAHREWNDRRWEARLAAERHERITSQIEQSFVNAHERFGEDFLKAYGAVQAANDPALVQRIMASPNPGTEAMRWHRSQTILKEVGNDSLDVFIQKKIEQAIAAKVDDPEFRKAQLQKWRAEANGNGNTGNGSQQPTTQPRTITRLPSLNGQPGGAATTRNVQTFDNSEQGLFESAWAD